MLRPDRGEGRGRPGWSTIAAVKNQASSRSSDDVASRWGPRIVDFMQARRGGRAQVAARAGDRGAAGSRSEREAARAPSPGATRWPSLAAASSSSLGSAAVGLARRPGHLGVGRDRELGGSHLPFLGIHSHLSAPDAAILWQLRAPRVVLGALVGGMLALAGASYQGAFRNPLADPYLLGIAAGAGLGATIAIAYAPRRGVDATT